MFAIRTRQGARVALVALLVAAPLTVLTDGAASAGVTDPPTCDGSPATDVGTAGKDSLSGTAGRDVITALASADVVRGRSGDDLLCGDEGNDLLIGGSGDDVLFGGAGHDLLKGGSGGDTLTAGAGNDVIIGGSGNDTISAVNGARDAINCGSGNDTVSADLFDVVTRNCEHVHRQLLNAAPTAVADSATVDRYSTSNTINVLANDTHPATDPLTVTAVTQPANGTVTIAEDGQSVDYVPATSYCNSDASGDDLAADTFTYTLNGGSTATVSVTVAAPDDPPTVTGLTRQRGLATPVPITNYLSAVSNTLANGARITLHATQTADPAACGSDTLSYRWRVSYQGYDPFTDAGITGSRTPNLEIAINALLPIQQNPGATIQIAATSSVSGRTTTVTFKAFVSQTTLSVDRYNYCQSHTTADPGCAIAGPSTEP